MCPSYWANVYGRCCYWVSVIHSYRGSWIGLSKQGDDENDQWRYINGVEESFIVWEIIVKTLPGIVLDGARCEKLWIQIGAPLKDSSHAWTRVVFHYLSELYDLLNFVYTKFPKLWKYKKSVLMLYWYDS